MHLGPPPSARHWLPTVVMVGLLTLPWDVATTLRLGSRPGCCVWRISQQWGGGMDHGPFWGHEREHVVGGVDGKEFLKEKVTQKTRGKRRGGHMKLECVSTLQIRKMPQCRRNKKLPQTGGVDIARGRHRAARPYSAIRPPRVAGWLCSCCCTKVLRSATGTPMPSRPAVPLV